MAKKHYFWPITIIFVYIWDELGATNCNLYDKWAPKWACLGFPDFGFFSAVILIIFWLKIIFFLSNTMERLYMEAQDGLKTIVPPLFLNIFFYFLLV